MKPTFPRSRLAVLVAGALWLAPVGALAQQKGPSKDPEAMRLLRQSATYLTKLRVFSVRLTVGQEVSFQDKAKLKFFRTNTVTVMRPNKMLVVTNRPDGDYRTYYNGSTLTIVSVAEKHYVQAKAPPTYDAMIDMLRQRLGFRVPVADVFSPNLLKHARKTINHAESIGVEVVGATEAHHLAFFNKRFHWQIWIKTGDKPLPLMLMVTDVTKPLRPTMTAVFTNWNVAPSVTANSFEFKPGKGMARISLLPATKAKQ